MTQIHKTGAYRQLASHIFDVLLINTTRIAPGDGGGISNSKSDLLLLELAFESFSGDTGIVLPVSVRRILTGVSNNTPAKVIVRISTSSFFGSLPFCRRRDIQCDIL